MKRTILIVMACLCLVGMFGCNSKQQDNPTNYFGTDLAKLLLANERLNAQLLKNEGDIFENGAKVLRNLAATTSASYQASTTSSAQGNGTLTVEGTTFTFSNFEENCNSYDYFENLTNNIVTTCEVAADLIDEVKKNVRVVDKWVSSGPDWKFYLHVAENEEVLYEQTADQINICRRSRNTSGQDVYETYIRNDITERRMTYIPGVHYEFSEIMKNDGVTDYTLFVADCTKGYWEVSVVSGADGQFNITGMVMKEDICYSAYYDPQIGQVVSLQVISSDRQADLLTLHGNEIKCDVTLHAGGFDGIQNITITAEEGTVSSVQLQDTAVVHVPGSTGYTSLTGVQSGIVNLSNGKQLTPGSTYVDGQVAFRCAIADYLAEGGLCKGQLELVVSGDSLQDRMNNLTLFLAETGLVCRRNPDKMISDISRAFTELDAFVPYYRWNGNTIATVDGIRAGIQVERTRFDAMANLYETIKNDPVIAIDDVNFELHINFAPIAEMTVDADPLEGDVVQVQNITLTVSDMTLFVDDEPYMVNFALLEESGSGLIHIEVENSNRTTYTGGQTFTVTAAQVTVKLPTLPHSSYKLVAYISTEDGIRASGYKEFMDIAVTPDSPALTTETKVDYATFYTMVCEVAYQYGIPDQGLLEMKAEDGTYKSMTGAETEIATGDYRLAYTLSNGDSETSDYVYVSYTAP